MQETNIIKDLNLRFRSFLLVLNLVILKKQKLNISIIPIFDTISPMQKTVRRNEL